jgi:hypothetical protein
MRSRRALVVDKSDKLTKVVTIQLIRVVGRTTFVGRGI